MLELIFGSLLSFFITLFLLPVIIKIAANKKIIVPRHYRKVHKGNVSALGGIAIFLSVLLTMLFFSNFMDVQSIRYYLAAGTFVFIFGLSDDFRNMKPLYKLSGQLMGGVLLIFLGEISIEQIIINQSTFTLPLWLSTVISLIIIVWFINAFNFFDGIDMQASMTAIAFLLPAGIWFYITKQSNFSLLLISTSAALLAFLFYNRTPSKVFMGDAGTVTIGFIMAFSVIKFTNLNMEDSFRDSNLPYPFLFGLLAFQLPLLDALRVVCLRLLRGKNPMKADKTHIHHLLLKRDWKHSHIAFLTSGYTLFTFLINYQLFRADIPQYTLLLVNASFITLLYLFVLSRKK